MLNKVGYPSQRLFDLVPDTSTEGLFMPMSLLQYQFGELEMNQSSSINIFNKILGGMAKCCKNLYFSLYILPLNFPDWPN